MSIANAIDSTVIGCFHREIDRKCDRFVIVIHHEVVWKMHQKSKGENTFDRICDRWLVLMHQCDSIFDLRRSIAFAIDCSCNDKNWPSREVSQDYAWHIMDFTDEWELRFIVLSPRGVFEKQLKHTDYLLLKRDVSVVVSHNLT